MKIEQTLVSKKRTAFKFKGVRSGQEGFDTTNTTTTFVSVIPSCLCPTSLK